MRLFTDIKRLRVFVAVAEEGSITQAAQRLNVAQPWLSDQLRQLETQVGLPLLERSKGKPPRLAPLGSRFLSIGKKLLKACEEATDEINSLRSEDSNEIVLGVDPMTLFIPERNELITKFMRRRPDVHLHIESLPPYELLAGLQEGKLDLILTSSPDAEEMPEFEVMSLYESELHLFIPKSNAGDYEEAAKGRFEGAKMLTFPDRYHPTVLPRVKAQLVARGIEPVECPEHSFHAVIRYGAMLGLATVLPDFSDSVPEMRRDMHIRRMKVNPIKLNWSLIRHWGVRGKVADEFWDFAAHSSTTVRKPLAS